jgi:predicted nucleic acid-binding protein
MGLVLDSNVLIAAERAGRDAQAAVREALFRVGDPNEPVVISVITVAELAHGQARATTEVLLRKRQRFLDDLIAERLVVPVTTAIAIRAGLWNGTMAAKGLQVGLADLLIASTAAELGYRVVTSNVRHFAMIPGLEVVTL